MQVFWGRIFLVKGRSPIWGSQGTKSVEMQKVELGLLWPGVVLSLGGEGVAVQASFNSGGWRGSVDPGS